MEENVKFIRLESNYLKKFLKWFMGGASDDPSRRVLQSILCKKGILAVTDGFMIYEWDLRDVNTKQDTLMYFVLESLKELDGIYQFEIHGKYLVIGKLPMEIKEFPNYEAILHVGCLSFTKTDYEKMDLDVARIFFDPVKMRKILSFPLKQLAPVLLQIGRMISVRYEYSDIGKINLLLMPMHAGNNLPMSTLGPTFEGNLQDLGKLLDHGTDYRGATKYKESKKFREELISNENPS